MTHADETVNLPVSVDSAKDEIVAAMHKSWPHETAKQDDQGIIHIHTMPTAGAYGERITATIEPADNGVVVQLHSEAAVPTTAFDFHKNERNLKKLIKNLPSATKE